MAATRQLQLHLYENRLTPSGGQISRDQFLWARGRQAAPALNSTTTLDQDLRLHCRHPIHPNHRRCHPSAGSWTEVRQIPLRLTPVRKCPWAVQLRQMAPVPPNLPWLSPRDWSACSFLALKVSCSSRPVHPTPNGGKMTTSERPSEILHPCRHRDISALRSVDNGTVDDAKIRELFLAQTTL